MEHEGLRLTPPLVRTAQGWAEQCPLECSCGGGRFLVGWPACSCRTDTLGRADIPVTPSIDARSSGRGSPSGQTSGSGGGLHDFECRWWRQGWRWRWSLQPKHEETRPARRPTADGVAPAAEGLVWAARPNACLLGLRDRRCSRGASCRRELGQPEGADFSDRKTESATASSRLSTAVSRACPDSTTHQDPSVQHPATGPDLAHSDHPGTRRPGAVNTSAPHRTTL